MNHYELEAEIRYRQERARAAFSAPSPRERLLALLAAARRAAGWILNRIRRLA